MSASGAWAERLQRAWLERGAIARLLWPLAALFGLLVRTRRALYRIGVCVPQCLDIPVVVVGNLVAGGAGKTPTVLAVLALLRRRGYTPGVITRGYGRKTNTLVEVLPDTPAAACGDEPLLLRLRGAVPVLVGRDRVQAARDLCRRHPQVDVLVSDDGRQHLRLARDAEVLVFDERGAGNGWLLPAGPLREPLPARRPDRCVLLYNAPAPSTPLPGHLVRRQLAGAVDLAAWWRGAPADPAALEALRGRCLLAVAGLARPQRFFAMLRERGLDIVEHALPDHHDYAEVSWPAGTAELVVTEKDAVKLDPARFAAQHIWVVALDFATDAAFDAELLALLPPPRPTRPT